MMKNHIAHGVRSSSTTQKYRFSAFVTAFLVKYLSMNNLSALRESEYNTNNYFCFQVSWIRSRDLTILTIGLVRYTRDQRFTAIHGQGTNNWGLKVINLLVHRTGGIQIWKLLNGLFYTSVRDTIERLWHHCHICFI